jgi:hypothetical protein
MILVEILEGVPVDEQAKIAVAATEGVLAHHAGLAPQMQQYGGGESPQFSRATSGARNSRNTGDHLAYSGPLEEWPRSLSSSK